MNSARSYAKAYIAATEALDASERMAWLMVLRDRSVARTLIRLLQRPDAAGQCRALGMPERVAQFLRIIAEDRALSQVTAIAEQGLLLVVEQGIGLPVRLTTARPAPSDIQLQISQALTQVADGPVLVESHVDPRVLGGFRIEVGTSRLDRTLTSRLAALKRTLVGA